MSALMKTSGKMTGYYEYEKYGESSCNDAPPFILPDPTKKWNLYLKYSIQNGSGRHQL